MDWACSSQRTWVLGGGLPLLCVFGCRGPGLGRYLENRERLDSFPDLALQPSPVAVCDPFGIARNLFDTFQGQGHAVSFHPVQLGHCHQTGLLRDSCRR